MIEVDRLMEKPALLKASVEASALKEGGKKQAPKALQKEWDKLHKRAWDLNKVMAKSVAKALMHGQDAHFGEVMELLHLKNAQLAKELQEFKARIVYMGRQRERRGRLLGSSHRARHKRELYGVSRGSAHL